MAGSTIGIGEVIFVAIKPMIKMAVIAGGGVFFAKKGAVFCVDKILPAGDELLPGRPVIMRSRPKNAVNFFSGLLTPEACKANASIIMNLLLPMLIFATVLPAFDRDNMISVLSTVITGILYQAMGLIFGLVVRWLTPVPQSWRGGVLAAGMFSNLGDLVISYISTLGKSEPFNGEEDIAKGIAYSSIFMVVQLISLFNLGGLQLIKGDFGASRESLTDIEKPPISTKPPVLGAPFSVFESIKVIARTMTQKSVAYPQDINPQSIQATALSPELPLPTIAAEKLPHIHINPHSPHSTVLSSEPPSPITRLCTPDIHSRLDEKDFITPSIPPTKSLVRRLWISIKPFITAPSIALVVSLVVANVPVLRALFVKTKGVHMPNAPDKQPPLDFVMDIASFAEPSVPVLGLLLLGAAMSRLSMKGLPKGFWKSAVLMALLKLVIGPIIGIAWTTGLSRQTGWISSGDKMLTLALIIGSAAPTATAQVYITNIFAPLGPEGCVEMSALSAILLAQYALVLITLTATVCYSLVFVI